MHIRYSAVIASLLLGLAHGAGAQTTGGNTVPPAAPDTGVQVDVSRLPINLARIQRQLRLSEIREERDGLNLRYFVDVYAKAPALQFFTKEDNLMYGPVPYGGPTHKQILEVITPQEHRSPVMDFSSVFRWLADKSK